MYTSLHLNHYNNVLLHKIAQYNQRYLQNIVRRRVSLLNNNETKFGSSWWTWGAGIDRWQKRCL